MIKYQPSYQTPIFSEASKLPLEERLFFLERLQHLRTYRPDYNDKTFSDTLNICVDTSGLESHEFSAKLGVRLVLFKRWLKGQSSFLPFPLARRAYALTAIDVTLLANGWIGALPEPPIRDGSNILHFPKRRVGPEVS